MSVKYSDWLFFCPWVKPPIKTEIIKNNKWTKIHFSKIEIESLIKKLQAFTGNKNPKQMNENEN